MKIIIMIFFVIFVIWYIVISVYDIIYSFRKKKSNEKEITIDLTEITKQWFQEYNKNILSLTFLNLVIRVLIYILLFLSILILSESIHSLITS